MNDIYGYYEEGFMAAARIVDVNNLNLHNAQETSIDPWRLRLNNAYAVNAVPPIDTGLPGYWPLSYTGELSNEDIAELLADTGYDGHLPLPSQLVTTPAQPETNSATAAKVRCAKCDLPFANVATMRKHFKRKHVAQDKTPYRCTLCGKAFADSKGLKRHLGTHQAKSIKYQCPASGCGRTYSRPDNCVRHIKQEHQQLVLKERQHGKRLRDGWEVIVVET